MRLDQQQRYLEDIAAEEEKAGVFDDCAFALVADHGMEQNDPGCRGDWDVALREAAVAFDHRLRRGITGAELDGLERLLDRLAANVAPADERGAGL